jgi:hypothetical protein
MGLAPSTRHPVAPTTSEERGEVPIPLPVLCSRGGRQLYTKRTDHRFCWLADCLAQFFPTSPAVIYRLFFDSRTGCTGLWESRSCEVHTHKTYSAVIRDSRYKAELNSSWIKESCYFHELFVMYVAAKRGLFSEGIAHLKQTVWKDNKLKHSSWKHSIIPRAVITWTCMSIAETRRAKPAKRLISLNRILQAFVIQLAAFPSSYNFLFLSLFNFI